jgi:GT2 family glycosyltransferase
MYYKEKNLAVIVLTWNDYRNTISCLKSLIDQKYNNYKIFLVDNNSTDGSLEKIINWFLINYKNKFLNKQIETNRIINKLILKKYKIFYLKNKKNLGCGFGHNSGFKVAIKNNFELISRIDNDMIAPKDFLKKITKSFENKNVLGVSPKILYSHNRKLIWWMGTNIGNNLKWQKHMRNYAYGTPDNKKIKGLINTDSIAGCASIIRSSAMKKFGLNDKDFFYGPEDIEYSRRIYSGEDSLKVDLDTTIYHGVTQSFRNLNNQRIYYEYKYRLLLIKKIGTPLDKFFGYSISLIKFLLYVLLFFKKKHKKKIIPVFYSILHFYQNKLGHFDREKKFILK